VVLAMLAAAVAQVPSSTATRSSLRAVALLRLDGQGGATLIPISLYTGGRYYDASLYRSMPVPLSLQVATVYEGFHLGESKGVFTVSGARRLASSRWLGVGDWKSSAEHTVDRKILMAKKKPEEFAAPADPSRPVLHRRAGSEGDSPQAAQTAGGSKGAPATPSAGSTSASAKDSATAARNSASTDTDRPVLHRRGESAAPASSTSDTGVVTVQTASNGQVLPPRGDDTAGPEPGAAAKSTPGADDPDRPVLRRPQETRPAAARDEGGAEPLGDDPDRPHLRHGKAAAPKSAAPSVLDKDTEEEAQYLAAVSDAGRISMQPVGYQWSDEATRMDALRRMKEAAAFELRQASRRLGFPVADFLPPPPPAPPSRAKGRHAATPPPPPPPPVDPLIGALQDVEMTAIDPEFSNTPVLILRARYMPESWTDSPQTPLVARERGVRVTLFCRLNWDGELQKLLVSVSDPLHLDESPELRFIDVVDADGGGHLQLLAERRESMARRFVLYKLYGRSLTELFATTPR
jgi:hypothetical protein